MNKVVVVVVLAAIASILLYLTILALVPRYDYGFGAEYASTNRRR